MAFVGTPYVRLEDGSAFAGGPIGETPTWRYLRDSDGNERLVGPTAITIKQSVHARAANGDSVLLNFGTGS